MTGDNFMKMIKTLLILLYGITTIAAAQIQLPRANQVNVSVLSSVSYNRDTGLFTYSYSLSNFADAAREVSAFHIPLRGTSIVNIVSPAGWESMLSFDNSMVHWCACAEAGYVAPPNYEDDGRGLPNKFQIKPGETLSGFSFQSAYPQAPSVFFAAGWIPVFTEGIDYPEGQEPALQNFPANLFSGTLAAAPAIISILEYGGRRPSVDGFLVFTSLQDGGAYSSPLRIDVAFGQQGEAVNINTFKAVLNGTDITSEFVSLGANQKRAVLNLGVALKTGKNVLQTAVQGTVPGASRTATDTDRVTFLIQ